VQPANGFGPPAHGFEPPSHGFGDHRAALNRQPQGRAMSGFPPRSHANVGRGQEQRAVVASRFGSANKC